MPVSQAILGTYLQSALSGYRLWQREIHQKELITPLSQ